MCFKSAKEILTVTPSPQNVSLFKPTTTMETPMLACEEDEFVCERVDEGVCFNGICCGQEDYSYCNCEIGYQGTLCEQLISMESMAGLSSLNVGLLVFFTLLVLIAAAVALVFWIKKRSKVQSERTPMEAEALRAEA